MSPHHPSRQASLSKSPTFPGKDSTGLGNARSSVSPRAGPFLLWASVAPMLSCKAWARWGRRGHKGGPPPGAPCKGPTVAPIPHPRRHGAAPGSPWTPRPSVRTQRGAPNVLLPSRSLEEKKMGWPSALLSLLSYVPQASPGVPQSWRVRDGSWATPQLRLAASRKPTHEKEPQLS